MAVETAKLTSRPVPLVEDPPYPVQGALYFLEGQYLFRNWDGKTVTSKFVTAADLAAAFSKAEQDTGWLPAGVVRAGNSKNGPFFVYSAPPQKIEIRVFGVENSLTIPIPRTVMLGLNYNYFLWCAKTSHFDLQAEAYQAPFPNINVGGRICWGTHSPPAADPRAARKAWELFFSTPFNHDLSNAKSQAEPGNVLPFLRGLADKKVRSYPAGDLVGTNNKVALVIERLLEA